jgi:exopolyphosphatase/guanosine-5'-triphosphate,3'-diphosphate pyrophosphatase
MVHDIGIFININSHHQHGYYIVKNTDILGFDQHELSLIASLVYFHKKGTPNRKLSMTADLPDEMIESLGILSLILQLAESLDRSHCSRIDELKIETPDSLTLQFNIKSRKGFEVEAASIIKHKNAIKKIFNRNLLIKQID